MKTIYLYCDGSSLGNPGFGGYCAILKYKNRKKIVKGAKKNVTNNQMELLAAIKGLEALKEPCEVILTSDSNYVVKAINEWLKGWIKKDFKNIKNVELWKNFIKVSNKHRIKAIWVKGHNGHEENEECDKIARGEAEKLKGKSNGED